jgi:glycosyltransferase involved in cell wall biosynthesis
MSEKKDILFLCQYFYPEYVSSATLPFDTAQTLVEDGFSVDALCGYPKEYNTKGKVPMKEIYKGIEIERLRYLQLERTNFFGRAINYFSFTFSVLFKFTKLRNYKSIIVYSNPPLLPLIPALAKIIFDIKFVFVSYDIYPEIANKTNETSESGLITKGMNLINKFVFKYVDKVVALSSEMKKYLVNNRKDLNQNQVEIIPNWYKDVKHKLDELQINTNENKLFEEIDQDYLVVSYFGNLEKNIYFVFAGHGNKMDRLKKIVSKENLTNVSIYGFLHNKEYLKALKISDVFLVSLAQGVSGLSVPSKTYAYMMAGKPIISIMSNETDIAKDLRDNNAGYNVEVGNVKGFIKSIENLNNVNLRESMGENCRELFEKKYKKNICTSQYSDLFKKMLNE